LLSVLIYQKSSQGFIDRYRALFEPYEESGKIAFCFWDEHGTDLVSALPELAGIVRGVPLWKAIVVMPVPDSDGGTEELIRQDNPFDFLQYADPEPAVHESDVPLIRLAQMLGGVPLVSQHYENTTTDTNQMRVLRREKTEELQRQQRIWNELNDKYSFTCARPDKLFLLKARIPMDIRLPVTKDIDMMNRHESDSSLFWYRNRYPAKARFLIQDCARAGNVRYQGDLFRFWMTALTLAINDFPTGTFEAYKVYKATGKLEREKVHELFSDYYNRLGGVQYFANIQIGELQKSSQFVRKQESLPMYQCEIPVYFKLEDDENLTISSKKIGLSGDCPQKERPWWSQKVLESIKAVRKLHSSIRIVLDRASIQCRYTSKVTEDEFYELDEYQFEELEQQLTDLETKILSFSTYTALPMKRHYRDLVKAEKFTASEMEKRMSRRTTVLAGVVALLVYLIGFVPDLCYQLLQGEAFLSTLGLSLLGCAGLLLVICGCLAYFRMRITGAIGRYNGVVLAVLNNFRRAGEKFSEYLSGCCSLMRGRYILQALRRKTLVSSEEIVQIGRHVEQLEMQMGVVVNWLSDFDLKPLPDNGSHSHEYFDFDIPPENNRGYSIEQDFAMNQTIPSVGGSTCRTPFPFITEFTVTREPVFETESKLYEDTQERGDGYDPGSNG